MGAGQTEIFSGLGGSEPGKWLISTTLESYYTIIVTVAQCDSNSKGQDWVSYMYKRLWSVPQSHQTSYAYRRLETDLSYPFQYSLDA